MAVAEPFVAPFVYLSERADWSLKGEQVLVEGKRYDLAKVAPLDAHAAEVIAERISKEHQARLDWKRKPVPYEFDDEYVFTAKVLERHLEASVANLENPLGKFDWGKRKESTLREALQLATFITEQQADRHLRKRVLHAVAHVLGVTVHVAEWERGERLAALLVGLKAKPPKERWKFLARQSRRLEQENVGLPHLHQFARGPSVYKQELWALLGLADRKATLEEEREALRRAAKRFRKGSETNYLATRLDLDEVSVRRLLREPRIANFWRREDLPPDPRALAKAYREAVPPMSFPGDVVALVIGGEQGLRARQTAYWLVRNRHDHALLTLNFALGLATRAQR